MKIPEEIIEKVKEQNDIVDIVSETVRLKKAGRNYFGLCPFHHEKSPSFSVSQDKQIYKCFGCGEAGNILSFVMKTKNLSFIEAIKYLAERANISFEVEDEKQNRLSSKKQLFFNINKQTGRFFFSNLYKNKVAKEYFFRRGITEGTIRKFGLGYSLDSWNSLLNFLKVQGFNYETVVEAGLAIKSEKGSTYDRFRNRVMFPVFDYKGNVIGFGGRVLDDSKPKYLNSPETLIFHKGTNLYGLNFAIKNGLSEKCFVVVEGYMDCIALHQYGITNVVASLGTALTINQARLLKRYADKVVISYDADFAGQTATIRGLEILKSAGLDVRVLTVPSGKDPDEFIRSNGKEAFLKLIEYAEPFVDYRLKKAKEGIDFKNNEMLITYGERVTEILASVNPIEKDIYVKKIAEETSIREETLYELISKRLTKNTDFYSDVNKKEEFGTKLYVEPAYLKAERSLLKLLTDKKLHNYIIENIKEEDLIIDSHKTLFSNIKNFIKEDDLEKRVELSCSDTESLKEWIIIKEMNVINNDLDEDVLIKDYIYQLEKHSLEQKKKEIKEKLKEFEKKKLFNESITLVKEAKIIDDKLKGLERG